MRVSILTFALLVLMGCSNDEPFEDSNQSLRTYSLTVSNTEGGTIDNNGGNYLEGDIVTIIATPNPGYYFTGWAGDLTGSENPISIEITENTNISAQF